MSVNEVFEEEEYCDRNNRKVSGNEVFEEEEYCDRNNRKESESRSVSFNVAEDEHLLELEKLCACLNTHQYDGLTCKYAKYLLKTHGENKYSRPTSSVSTNSLVRKLLPGKSANGEWSKKDWDKVFNRKVDDEFIVLREGRKLLIRRKYIVRGDLIHLKRGQTVPADIRIIACENEFVSVDNRIITSNCHEEKSCTPTSTDFLLSQNMIFACTSIIRGSCEGIVLSTGDQTVFAELTQFATKVRYVKRPSSRGSSTSSLSSGSMSQMSLPNSLGSVGELSLPSSLDLTQSGSTLSIGTTTSVLSL